MVTVTRKLRCLVIRGIVGDKLVPDAVDLRSKQAIEQVEKPVRHVHFNDADAREARAEYPPAIGGLYPVFTPRYCR